MAKTVTKRCAHCGRPVAVEGLKPAFCSAPQSINEEIIGPNPSGLCMCGCKGVTPIAGKTRKKYGWVKGRPLRFIHGHHKHFKGPNPVRHLSNGTSVLTLLHKGEIKECFVDTEDYPLVAPHHWGVKQSTRTFYAVTEINGRGTRMHCLLIPGEEEIDHRDHCGLQNTRNNLRAVTRQENGFNQQKQKRITTSKYKGVHWYRQSEKWRAQIRFNGTGIYLGTFRSEEDAAHAYDAKAKELFGEFACINFPTHKPPLLKAEGTNVDKDQKEA